MMSPIVAEMIEAAYKSVDQLKDSIINVKSEGFDAEFKHELISFEVRGEKFIGKLSGRNRDLCIGFGAEQDKAIAARVLIDGDAYQN